MLFKCASLWRAVCRPSATERPLRTIRDGRDGNFSPVPVSISRDMTLAVVKPHDFLTGMDIGLELEINWLTQTNQ